MSIRGNEIYKDFYEGYEIWMKINEGVERGWELSVREVFLSDYLVERESIRRLVTVTEQVYYYGGFLGNFFHLF